MGIEGGFLVIFKVLELERILGYDTSIPNSSIFGESVELFWLMRRDKRRFVWKIVDFLFADQQVLCSGFKEL